MSANSFLRQKKKIVTGFLLFFVCFFSSAAELVFKISPFALFPFLSAGETKWDVVGGGAFLDINLKVFDFLSIGPAAGALMVPKNNYSELSSDEAAFVTVIPVGLSANMNFYPASRLEFGLGGATGYGIGKNGSMSHFSPWYRATAEIGFRLNPQWSLGLNGAYFAYQDTSWIGNPGIGGVSAGISVKFALDTQQMSGSLSGTMEQDESVFPLFYTIYKDAPFATVTIQNNESAEIRNATVFFRAEGYTNSDIECGRIPLIKKRKKETLSVYADFGKELLRFTESGKIPGEIVVTYDFLGQERTAVIPVVVPVYNRNQIRWSDPSAIASFISASSQEVLEFSKVLVGLARNHLRSGLNRNMQFAMYLYEGMRLSGIACADDFETPYNEFHSDAGKLDYIQYPYQTLFYKSGEKDDVGILFMALLESVGISSAFIPLPDDFIVLLNTTITVDKASRFFNGDERFLTIDDEIWLPISMKNLKEGFINSWYRASATLQKLIAADADMTFVALSDAWQVYPPAGFSSGENIDVIPVESALIAAVELDMSRYISTEFGPQITNLKNSIKTQGATVDIYNQLGILYVRAGMYDDAIAVYERSASLGSVVAMNNLGNIASLRKKYLEAKKWYEKVLAVDPNNATARKNLSRVEGEIE